MMLIFYFFQANHYYKMFITWTNQKIKNTFVQRNMFEFQHIKVRLLKKYNKCTVVPAI